MSTRIDILSNFYNQVDEDTRLIRTRQGQLEYAVTMNYIHRFTTSDSRILEIGAGTGRYSIALAKEGLKVDAVELLESNLDILKQNSKGIDNLKSYKGDATDLKIFKDNSFDITLVFGPLYHLYDKCDVTNAITEAIRVTKPKGVILFSFLSVFAIMYNNYCYGNWATGQVENFSKDYKVRHFKEQLFTGYDVAEFEELFKDMPVNWITTVGVDSVFEMIQHRPDFHFSEDDFAKFIDWYLVFAEKRELLGSASHLLYICRKKCN